jgi:hypothetical protein
LGPDAVNVERRQKADHAVRYGSSYSGKSVVLSDRLLGQTVLTPGNALDSPFADKPREDLAVDAMPSCLPSGEDPLLSGKSHGFGDLRSLHV